MRIFNEIPLMSKVILAIALLFSSTYLYFFMNRAYVKVDLSTSHNTRFKIYWAKADQPYSEKRSAEVQIRKSKSNYLFYLANIKNAAKLRIDPSERPAQIRIKKLEINQNRYQTIRFSNPNDFEHLTPLNDTKKIHNDKKGYVVHSSGNDPQLEIHIQRNKVAGGIISDILRILIFLPFIVFLFKYTILADGNGSIINGSYLMIAAGTLILTMASMSKFNRHPDEYVHVYAGEYYEEHWMPPKICEKGTESTYSVYGVSRLNSHEPVYFIAGKFSSLLAVLPLPSYFRLRLFNVTLFIILILLTIKLPKYQIISLPLLFSPQTWYVFSYFNSDAFSLFIAYIVIYQIIKKDSLAHQFLEESNLKSYFPSLLILGILLFLALTLKKNFYFFSIFILIYFAINILNKSDTNPKMLFKRSAVIFLASAILLGLMYSVDIYVNGTDRAAKLNECREKLAKTKYKPSTPLEKSMPGLNLKKKGVSLKEVWTKYRWGEKSFRSAFGVYGYTSISASKGYYHIHRFVGLFFLLFIFWQALYKTDIDRKILLINAIICSVLLISTALWKSWTSDFQAQGRYFLPIIAICAFLLYQIRDFINARIFNIFIVIMFLTSLYSFVFIGLIDIPKQG